MSYVKIVSTYDINCWHSETIYRCQTDCYLKSVYQDRSNHFEVVTLNALIKDVPDVNN